MSAKRVYGIDLGTTYSCISRVDDHGRPEIIANAEGQQVTPSVVYFESEDNVVVGEAAKEEAKFHPELVVEMVKRQIGKKHALFEFHGGEYRPEEISAHILMKLVRDCEQITGEEVEDVVITCPAYFGVNQKEATKQAGEIAGLNVLYVIPEPTAAAIAYGFETDEDQVILVYDLGGGTFDVTLIEVKAGAITVLSTGGNDELGGKDWDGIVAEYLALAFSDDTGVPVDDVLGDPETVQNLMADAEDAKVMLSSREKVTKVVHYGADRAKVELTREKFEEITSHKLAEATGFTEEMVNRAREQGYEKIDKILLVGGSTYMPQVEQSLKKFGINIETRDPNLIVAKGAAIFGYKCKIEEEIKIAIAAKTGEEADTIDLEDVSDSVKQDAVKEVAQNEGLSLPGVENLVNKQIQNVTSKSFGVVVMDAPTDSEVVANLIQRDAAVPAEITQQFKLYEDNQSAAELRCMQNLTVTKGDEILAIEDCTEIGQGTLIFERPLPKGSPIEITFKLGPDGRLTVRGKDLTTKAEVEATFETDSVMSREQVESATRRALIMKES